MAIINIIGFSRNAIAVLKDSANNILNTFSIKSGETKNIPAPDATAIVKDSANNTLASHQLKSGETKNVPAPDATAVVKDSANNTLATHQLKSGETKNIPAPDAYYNVNMGSNQLATGALKSGSSTNINVPHPATVSLPLRTGQTTNIINGDDSSFQRGREESIYTLEKPNYFGSYHRFTGVDGSAFDFAQQIYVDNIGNPIEAGNAFPNSIILDWSFCDLEKRIVVGWYNGIIGMLSTLTYAFDEVSQLGVAGLGEWSVPNRQEIQTLINDELVNWSNLQIFNLDINKACITSTWNLWHVSHDKIYVVYRNELVAKTEAEILVVGGFILPIRYFTFDELNNIS